jgi:hypothetical protein
VAHSPPSCCPRGRSAWKDMVCPTVQSQSGCEVSLLRHPSNERGLAMQTQGLQPAPPTNSPHLGWQRQWLQERPSRYLCRTATGAASFRRLVSGAPRTYGNPHRVARRDTNPRQPPRRLAPRRPGPQAPRQRSLVLEQVHRWGSQATGRGQFLGLGCRVRTWRSTPAARPAPRPRHGFFVAVWHLGSEVLVGSLFCSDNQLL